MVTTFVTNSIQIEISLTSSNYCTQPYNCYKRWIFWGGLNKPSPTANFPLIDYLSVTLEQSRIQLTLNYNDYITSFHQSKDSARGWCKVILVNIRQKRSPMQLRKQVPRGSSFKSIYKLKFKAGILYACRAWVSPKSPLELLWSDVIQSIQVKINKGDLQRICYYSSQFPQAQPL